MRIDSETQAAFELLQAAKNYALDCARDLVRLPSAEHLADLSTALDIEARTRAHLAAVVACDGCRTSSSTR